MKRILLIADPNSVYIVNYIKYVLVPNNLNVTIYDIHHRNHKAYEYAAFFHKNNVSIITPQQNSIFYKIPKLQLIIRIFFTVPAQIVALGHFDFCHIHFVDPLWGLILPRCKTLGRMIASFWGSDLFCSTFLMRCLQKKIMKKAFKITLLTQNMQLCFSKFYGSVFNDKVWRVRFGVSNLELIKESVQMPAANDFKTKFGIPSNKILIACGYNSSKAHQHLKILTSLDALDPELKSSCYLLFPMSYGFSGTDYQQEILSLMEKYHLCGKVLSDYLPDKDVASLRLATDIFINVQTTDAISASMLEHLCAGNIMISGNWLNYLELEEAEILYFKVNSTEELAAIVTNCLTNIQELKNKCLIQNSQTIYDRFTWNHIKDPWLALYK